MKQLEPRGLEQRIASALLLLVGAAWAAHLIYGWLRPLLPLAISGVVLIGIWRLIFGRRWR